MNYSQKEFWDKVDEYDPQMRRYKNIALRREAKYLPRTPLSGPGSKGGGRVVVCDTCSHIKYVKSKTQQFCSLLCKKTYGSLRVTPKPTGSYKRPSILHKTCPICHKTFKITSSKSNEGCGIFCSRSCNNKARGFISLWYYCNTCQSKFKAITHDTSLYCSDECYVKDTHFEGDLDQVYVTRKPQLVEPDDRYEHIINGQMETVIKCARTTLPLSEISTTKEMRHLIESKKPIKGVAPYYLNDTEKSLRKLLIVD